MIPSDKYKKINIQITSKKKDTHIKYSKGKDMNDDIQGKKSRIPRFICAMCLNSQSSPHISTDNIKRKPCPICQRHLNDKQKHTDSNYSKNIKAENVASEFIPNVTANNNNVQQSKVVETSKSNLKDNVDLLNEVLTVFQRKKHLDNKTCNAKTILFKDACVSTDFTDSYISRDVKIRPKLGLSRIFQYSIDGNYKGHENFVIVNRCEPQLYKKSGIDLIKHKSDSIPLMKMDELKKSLKEKTKSKDAIEEINRMFATCKKRENFDDANRPLVRSGPRVLPVVKTFAGNEKNDSISDRYPSKYCRCCQTQNYYLSSGDCNKNEGCQIKENEKGNRMCDKSIYMMCCHYQKELQAGLMVCECCQNDRSHNLTKRYGRRNYDDNSEC